MPKRKRDGASAEAEAQEESYGSMKQQRVGHKLDHGQKLLARAFKTARGFERQKLGRRRKTAASESKATDVARIDAETAALKTLDLSSTAVNYLNKSLLKFKAVAESPDLPKSVSSPAPQSSDASVLNVIARLCNSNPVKEALPPILRDVQRALGIEVSADSKSKKRVRADKSSKSDQADDVGSKLRDALKTSKSDSEDEENEDDDEESSWEGFDSRVASGVSGPEDDSDDELDLSRYSSRLAGSSDSELDASDESDDERQPRKGAKPLKRARQLSISPSPSPSPEPQRARPTKSSFIPSLTTGYISGSGSEPESDIDTAPKKNRRGQRARQALAEKKFGSRAKHLQNGQTPANKDRNQGWDAKRGATDGARGFGRGGRGGRGGSRGGNRGGAGAGSRAQRDGGVEAAVPKPKHRDDEGALHPSWAAAKKAKEAKLAAPFQGKKITFD